MKKKYFFHFVLVSYFLGGCAAIRTQNCTENAGYEKGMNDAKMGRLMSLGQFAVFCDGSAVELAQKGYKSGYDAGKNAQGSSQVNLTFENGKLGVVGAYSCRISYQNQSFSDNSSTESEARNNVLKKCREKIPSCTEYNTSCSKN